MYMIMQEIWTLETVMGIRTWYAEIAVHQQLGFMNCCWPSVVLSAGPMVCLPVHELVLQLTLAYCRSKMKSLLCASVYVDETSQTRPFCLAWTLAMAIWAHHVCFFFLLLYLSVKGTIFSYTLHWNCSS